MNAVAIELAVSRYFGQRANFIIPNVSWGLFAEREVDLVVLRPSGWATEVEIKVSASDIHADLRKPHQHRHHMLRCCWFAVPVALASHPDIPRHCGVLAVHPAGIGRHGERLAIRVTAERAPTVNREARKLRPDEVTTLLRLGCLRIWSLKEHIQRLKDQVNQGRQRRHDERR